MPEQALRAGFVLHQRPYRESSSITELFTETEGRVSVMARGVRGMQRRGASRQLTVFRPYWLDWAGRGELPNLRVAEAAAPAHQLVGDAIFAGLYANELLLRLCTRHDPHPDVYQAYLKLLVRLEHDEQGLDIALRYFERDLLLELGYGLNLEYESGGARIDPTLKYAYYAEQGGIALFGTGTAGFSGAMLQALSRDELESPQHRLEAKQLLRKALKTLLGDKPLKSLQTLQRMKQMGRRQQPGDHQ